MNRVVRWSEMLIPTLKENPQEAQIKSHRLMLRSGMVRKLASGTYTYLPLGLRALHKAEQIVREEMDKAGAQEVLLPALHPAELWKETGRWDILGEDMIHFKDRHGKENVLGPTHEEVITDLARREVHSYKQLPLTLYQIQTKFRDEMRPRSGVIRSREFVMKDAYSFHPHEASLDETYQKMKESYQRIFTRCGLEFYVVQADPGAMGGSGSQEFVLFSDAGEDRMVQFGETDTVVSVEMASRKLKGLAFPKNSAQKKYQEIHTPGHSSVEGVSAYLKKKPSDLVKTMIFDASDPAKGGTRQLVAILVRGDREVSDYKVKQKIRKHIDRGANLASREVMEQNNLSFGFSGPVGLGIPLYIDEEVLEMKDFVVGANKNGYHLVDVNISDMDSNHVKEIGDFRQVVEGDISPEGKTLQFRTAIELGHIFKLNLRYSLPMKANYLDSDGKEKPVVMGCYGIGVNRILAAAIEQWGDDKGVVWPKNISPFQVEILIIDSKDAQSLEIAQRLASSEVLSRAGIDILIDDRPDTAGVKFNDADLVGIPLRVVLGPKNLKTGKAELKVRKTSETSLVDIAELEKELVSRLDKIA